VAKIVTPFKKKYIKLMVSLVSDMNFKIINNIMDRRRFSLKKKRILIKLERLLPRQYHQSIK